MNEYGIVFRIKDAKVTAYDERFQSLTDWIERSAVQHWRTRRWGYVVSSYDNYDRLASTIATHSKFNAKKDFLIVQKLVRPAPSERGFASIGRFEGADCCYVLERLNECAAMAKFLARLRKNPV